MERESLLAAGVGSTRYIPQQVQNIQQCIRRSPCRSPLQECHSNQDLQEIVSEQDNADRLRLQRQKIEVLKQQFQKREDVIKDKQLQIERLNHERESLLAIKKEYEDLVTKHDLIRYLVQQNQAIKNSYNQLKAANYDQKIQQLRQAFNAKQSELQICNVNNNRLEKSNSILKLERQDLEDNANYAIRSLKIKVGILQFHKWTQKPDLKWSPKAQIKLDDQLNTKLMSKHLEDHVNRYKQVTMVNLIDNKGSSTQRRLGQKFFTTKPKKVIVQGWYGLIFTINAGT